MSRLKDETIESLKSTRLPKENYDEHLQQTTSILLRSRPVQQGNARLSRGVFCVSEVRLLGRRRVFFYPRLRPKSGWLETSASRLTLSGQEVMDADTWYKKRRPEEVQSFETHVYGRSPPTPEIDDIQGDINRQELVSFFCAGAVVVDTYWRSPHWNFPPVD